MASMSPYERLTQDVDIEDEGPFVKEYNYGSKCENKPWLITTRNILILSLAIYGILDLAFNAWRHLAPIVILTHKNSEIHHASHCSCGISPEEAIANGCTFDPFAAAWLPQTCLDIELIEFFTSLNVANDEHSNSSFFTYPDPGRQLPVEEVSMMAKPVGLIPKEEKALVTTTADWHHTHCLYMLLKIVRSRSTGLDIEPRYERPGHTKHCVKTLLGWIRETSDVSGLLGASEIDIYP